MRKGARGSPQKQVAPSPNEESAPGQWPSPREYSGLPIWGQGQCSKAVRGHPQDAAMTLTQDPSRPALGRQ